MDFSAARGKNRLAVASGASNASKHPSARVGSFKVTMTRASALRSAIQILASRRWIDAQHTNAHTQPRRAKFRKSVRATMTYGHHTYHHDDDDDDDDDDEHHHDYHNHHNHDDDKPDISPYPMRTGGYFKGLFWILNHPGSLWTHFNIVLDRWYHRNAISLFGNAFFPLEAHIWFCAARGGGPCTTPAGHLPGKRNGRWWLLILKDMPYMPLSRKHRIGRTITLTALKLVPESSEVAEAPTTTPLWRGLAAHSSGPFSRHF